MDKLIKNKYKQKQFFSRIFSPELEGLGNLKDNQYIRIYQAKEDYSKVSYFNNIDNLIDYVSSNKHGLNTYFTLNTTTGESGTKENLINRTVLGFDFDKKDLGKDFNIPKLINKFKAIGLWYQIVIDSGNGYHAYMLIEPTKDIDKVVEVTKAIGKRLGADPKAMKPTQILRVPYTFNIKEKPKQVNIIKIYDKESIKRYQINKLYDRFCNNLKYQEGTGEEVTQYTVNNTNIPSCIEEILLEGSQEGSRYEDLKRLVVTLRERNKSLNEIIALTKEWAYKSNYNDSLNYRVKHIFKNLNYVSMDCKRCNHFKSCFNKIESDFNYPSDFNLLTITETHARTLKKNKRKGVKSMRSNDILIYGILKNHKEGLYKSEIEKELTYKDKPCLSKNVLTKALDNLRDNGFITIDTVDRKKFYKLKDIRSKAELTYNISYAATYEAVKGHISTEELRLYNYMRYLHNKQQREDKKALKGNLFQFNQRDLAKEMGLTQGRISVMINNLLEEKLLGIWYRQPSKNNGYDYYVYRLNY